MKNRKIKALFGMFFALALALSSGALLASAKTNKPAEIVLAEEEPDENEEPVSSEETPTTDEGEASGTEAPAEPREEAESATEDDMIRFEVTPKDVFTIIGEAFKDAIKDLIEHFKRWFKIK